MARRSSLWVELKRERERREREKRRAYQGHLRLNREAEQAHARAAKQAQREDATERRRQEQLAHEARAAEAAARTNEVDDRVAELQTLLVSTLHTETHIPFEALKRPVEAPRFEPGELAHPEPAPVWEDFEPRSPGPLSGLFGGKSRHERAHAEARQEFQHALVGHEHAEEERRRRLAQAEKDNAQRAAELEKEVRAHNAAVDNLAADLYACVPEAVEDYFTQVLDQSIYPDGFPHEYRVAYRAEPRELVIEYRLPGKDAIPAVRGFRYVKTRQEIDEHPRPIKEIKELYKSVISQVALRSMRECFAVHARDVVESVVFNGIVAARDPATGKQVEPCILSVGASRGDFDELVLEHLDPAACLKKLKAIMSPHPDDVTPVEPIIDFDKAKYRFTDPVDALAGLDSRLDLLQMDWYRFENLVRQLFEAMGMEVHITQSSRDEGIDAVAYVKTDAIHRAEYIIQAKRYKRIVSAESVRALAGVVEEKRATRGFLATTSWFGAASRTFATKNNRIQLIDGGELKHLLAEHLGLDVRIDHGRTPPKQA